MIRALLLAGMAPLALATPAFGQTMDHSMHNMPGMTMPAKPAAKPPSRKRKPQPSPRLSVRPPSDAPRRAARNQRRRRLPTLMPGMT